MTKVEAFKCEYCNELFENEEEFNNHLERCDESNVEEKIDSLLEEVEKGKEGWVVAQKQEIDREDLGVEGDPPEYDYSPKVERCSEIGRIMEFVVRREYQITEEIIYIKEE